MRHIGRKENELGWLPRCADSEQAKFVPTINLGKNLLAVLKIVETHKLSSSTEIAKEILGGIVRRDTRGHNNARPPRRG